MRVLMLALALCSAPALAQAASPAITDPVPDPAHPPRSQQVLIPTPTATGPEEMNALFYLSAGAGPHPTMILFHGFPGNEQNLDLAQAARRAGWNVLTLHYRGSWGSPGNFSIAHVLEDAHAAYAFVEDPARAARYGIDRAHVVVAGHSMGGFAAASVARTAPELAGLVLIDAWDVGADGAKFAKLDPAARHAEAPKRFDDLGHSLAGTSEAAVADEIAGHAKDWELLDWAPQLTRAPMLVIGAAKAGGAKNHALGEAVARAGGKVTNLTMDTDHSFSDRRIGLASTLVAWLDKLRSGWAAR